MKINATKRLLATAPVKQEGVAMIPRWHTGDQAQLDTGFGELEELDTEEDADDVSALSW